MAWSTISVLDMQAISLQVFKPCILLVNYTLLQYLMVFYWSRRREPRILLLFAIGVMGVVCLIPFANADSDLTSGLNDVSESCSVITFLLQIIVLGRDLNKKIKFKTVLYLTWVAELLVAADLIMVLFSLVSVAWPEWLGEKHASLKDDLPNVFENLNLAFIFFFRFYYTVQSRGWREILTKRKQEILCYLLFATHEVPFTILEEISGLSWESVQAMWHRVTLACCLYITATAKLRDHSSIQTLAESINSIHRHSRSSIGRNKRGNTSRRNSTIYAVAMASVRTASIDRTSVITIKKEAGGENQHE